MSHPTASASTKPIAVHSFSLLAAFAAVALAAGGCGGNRSATTPPPAPTPAASAQPAPAEQPAAAAPAPAAVAPAPAPTPEATATTAPAEPAKADAAPSAEAPKDVVKMSKEYWPSGKLKFTYELRKSANGKWAKNGVGRAYYDTGPLEREGLYKNNIRVGKWTYYGPDGKVLRVEERGTDGHGGNDGDPPLP